MINVSYKHNKFNEAYGLFKFLIQQVRTCRPIHYLKDV